MSIATTLLRSCCAFGAALFFSGASFQSSEVGELKARTSSLVFHATETDSLSAEVVESSCAILLVLLRSRILTPAGWVRYHRGGSVYHRRHLLQGRSVASGSSSQDGLTGWPPLESVAVTHFPSAYAWGSPKGHINRRILHSGSQAQQKADSRNHVWKIVLFMWSVGP